MNSISRYDKLFTILCTLFCTCIVIGNLIFQKYVEIDLYFYKFELSVGALIYPITFLITDLIAEFYGKERSDYVVKTGFIISIFVCILITIASKLNATSWSKVSNQEFNNIFGMYTISFTGSLLSNFIAQLIDIRIYLFLKKATNNKYIWLRNNLSTILSQIIDTLLIYSIMKFFKIIPSDKIISVFISAILFKIIFTAALTPAFYIFISLIKSYLIKK